MGDATASARDTVDRLVVGTQEQRRSLFGDLSRDAMYDLLHQTFAAQPKGEHDRFNGDKVRGEILEARMRDFPEEFGLSRE